MKKYFLLLFDNIKTELRVLCGMIYFDNAATSLIKPSQVKLAVFEAVQKYTANPGRSGHKLSQLVAEKIFETRETIKDFFNARAYEVVFTKNCTEALNLAILGTLKKDDHVITTCYEHNSVLRPLKWLEDQGVELTIVDCELKDFPHELEKFIKKNTKLVITTFVSNVTGDMCDVFHVAKICKKHNLKYLIDGAQACGHIKIDLEKIGADMVAFAGHKGLMSITGVGGLVVKNLEDIKPIMYGGTGTESKSLYQPFDSVEGFESGTLSSISIISLKAGVDFVKENFLKIIEKEHKLSEYLYNSLKKIEKINVFSHFDCKNVVSFTMQNMPSDQVANILNERFNICVRSGLHCAPLIHKRLGTKGCGAVRISVDFNNTFAEIDYLVHTLKLISSF